MKQLRNEKQLGKSKRVGENRVPVPLCPQISHCYPKLNISIFVTAF